MAIWDQTSFQVTAVAVGAAVFVLCVVAITVTKFYRRCGADEALVRTGAGGNKVVIGGGIFVYPILHQLLRVSLRSTKLSVEREGKNALVTRDKIKANVTTELYVKVEPLAEDVLAAARSFGERSLDVHAIGSLIEGKLTDALRSVAANQAFMDLHSQRKQFAEHIQNALAEELKKNGLTLENVSITSFSMVAVNELDGRDVFDAEGLRAITESVQSNAEKTNQIQREKETAIKATNVEAKKRALAMEQDQAQAEADQQRRVQEYSATQRAETARAVYAQEQIAELAAYEKQRMTEMARIAQEKDIAVAQAQREKAQQMADVDRQKTLETAMIDKQKSVEAAEIAKQQAVETARIAKEIAIVQSQEQAARAEALKAQAEADEEAARQAILTVEETAKAQRAKAVAIVHAEEKSEEARIAAEREAARVRLAAEAEAEAVRARDDGEAQATVTLAHATLRKGEADAEAKRKLVEADNAVATKLLLRDVVVKALDVMPSVTRELMTPAHAIKEIKVLQLQGGAAANGNAEAAQGGSSFGVASPILKTILEAGAAYPLLREMLNFSQVDTGDLADKARALMSKLPAELRTIVDADPELAAKVNALTTTAPPAPETTIEAAE